MKKGIVVVIVLILVVGVGAYFLLFGQSFNYPDQVLDYKLTKVDDSSKWVRNLIDGCGDFNAEGATEFGKVCVDTIRLEYKDNNQNRGVFIRSMKITEGRELYESFFNIRSSPIQISSNSVFKLEDSEIGWWTANDRLILTTEYEFEGTSYSYGSASGANPITKWFLEEYPPIE